MLVDFNIDEWMKKILSTEEGRREALKMSAKGRVARNKIKKLRVLSQYVYILKYNKDKELYNRVQRYIKQKDKIRRFAREKIRNNTVYGAFPPA